MPSKPLTLLLLTVSGLFATTRADHYALVLADPPLGAIASSREQLSSAAMAAPRARIDAAQTRLRTELGRRNILVLSSTNIVLNAVYVLAGRDQMDQLAGLPGVVHVQRMLPLKLNLNRAAGLVNAPAAWSALGGQQNAGLGRKIGIIDTGIDQTHPAFQDPGLSMPSGFPKCNVASDCAYTNTKVIVARSYVATVAAGDPANSRPDDLTPRDRDGHGTAAAMIAAGGTVKGPVASITGIAPKAYLGNYKIFGSPGVNSFFTYADVVMKALDDAAADGMDVVSILLGGPALFNVTDRGAACGLSGNTPCDAFLDAVQTATTLGMSIVVSAGNDGNLGINTPMFGSIESPGTAPDVITVGASTNAHILYSSVKMPGAPAPFTQLQQVNAFYSDGFKPAQPLMAPVRDTSTLGNNGEACVSFSAGALAGAIALVQRGASTCTFAAKALNVQAAGAVGLIVINTDDTLFQMFGLSESGIPAVLIGSSDGGRMQGLLATKPDFPGVIDPALTEVTSNGADVAAPFTSYGPATGTNAIKPELVAVGSDLYTAAQNYDPNGEMYDPSRFTSVAGTSFAGAMVAGAAALVKQANPGLTPAQIKSSLVNTANPAISAVSSNGSLVPAPATAMGSGKLDAGAAVQSNVQVSPATVSFGVVSVILPSQNLTISNTGKASVTLQLSVTPRDADNHASVSLSSSSVTIAAGGSSTITVQLKGSLPTPGKYEGAITIQGAAVSLRIPYLYVVGDGTPVNAIALFGDGFAAQTGDSQELDVKVVDQYGAPVTAVPVRFYSTAGGGSIANGTATTDNLGIAQAFANVGPQVGSQQFAVDIGNPKILTVFFSGDARAALTIATNGVVNAASGQVGQGLAPGSYISIFGSGLADLTRIFVTPYLPLSLARVSVSFDVPAKNISVPGRVEFVSTGQINVQIPWELQGQSSAILKVSIGNSSSNLYTVPLNDYSPALFEYQEASSGKLLAAAQDSKFVLIGSNHAIARGDTVVLYANGLGPVNNQPASGEPSPSVAPLATTKVLPGVSIGSQPATVSFSGMTPGIVGLYQINATVPSNIAAGIQPVVVTVNGVASKTSQLPVQ